MEVAKRLWLRVRTLTLSWLIPAWFAFANVVGGFIEEAAFRVVLAFKVLTGRMPLEVEKHWWNRSAETPTLLNVYDWTDDRLIFSVLIWPRLETPVAHQLDAVYKHHERVEEVKRVIARGAAEMVWATRFETDNSLTWDAEREVWAAGDGFAYASPESTGDAAPV